ncbi:MAG: tetratricopeptide repeat protein [Planctomycetales bacterium]|nr:tetratricopeptide repeat protein [Planctomycetales bacterium]
MKRMQFLLASAVVLGGAGALSAGPLGLGQWLSGTSNARSERIAQAPARVTVAVPSQPASPPAAPQTSQLTFPASPLAPQPSVTIPAATSPAGRVEPSGWRFGQRISGFASNAREALTIKPREIPAADPVRLGGDTREVQAPVLVSSARVFEGQGRNERAKEQYEKALAADPKNLDALVGLARLEHRDGDLAAATQRYLTALKLHPDHPVVLNDLGLCYARRGMLQQAEQSMSKAVAAQPTSKLYRNNMALVLVELNRNDEALAHLAAVHPVPVAHYNLAYMLSEKGRQAEAAAHLKAALAADPQMESARQLLARVAPQAAPAEMSPAPRLGMPQIETSQPPQSQGVAQGPYAERRTPAPVVLPDEAAAWRAQAVSTTHNNASRYPQTFSGDVGEAPAPGAMPDYMRSSPAASGPGPSRWDPRYGGN